MVLLKNAVDNFVLQTAPNANYQLAKILALTAGGGGQERLSYIYFGKPAGFAGSTVLSATLRVYNTALWSGSVTLSAQRLSTSWSASKITYNQRPTLATGPISTVVKSNAAVNTEWAFDVTATMQQVADGGIWYGFVISTNNTSAKYLYSSQFGGAVQPTLELVWSAQPQAPEVLRPDGDRAVSLQKPTLRFDFTDHSGSTSMAGCQVQLNTADVWTGNLTFDSGPVNTTLPQLDLNAPVVSERIGVVTTNISTTVTGPTGTFSSSDVGSSITGTGIPGGATISAFTSSTQVTISAAATASGTIVLTVTKTYAGLADTAHIFWRVKVKDGAGLWSLWSESAQFQRQVHGTLTLNNPAASPNNFIYDSTPPIDWGFTGKVQKHRQVIISLASNTAKWLWDSGKITTASTVITLPLGVLKQDDAIYNVRVRVWDTLNREATPGDNAYVEVSRDFTFNDDITVVPVTGLALTPDGSRPWMQLDWQRVTQPDKFEIVRDKKPILNFEASSLFISGTSYRYTDKLADPRINHTWTVYAIVNNKRSASPDSEVGQVKTVSTYICEVDSTDGVLLLKPDNSPELKSINEVHEVLAETPPVLITQAIRGNEGKVSGRIADNTLTGRTARQQLASLKKWRDQQGIPLILYLIDETFQVVAYNITYKAIAKSGNQVQYQVSFDYFQTDF